MDGKILTVSIAAYNAEKYLNQCLSSFLLCKHLDLLDIIVVDDGSTDKTADVANSYVSEAPGSIRLISKKNGGHGSTINTSIANARGRYYKVVDADDWIDPKALDELVDFLSISDVDVVINPYIEEHEDTHRVNKIGFDVILPNFNVTQRQTIPFDSIADPLHLFMHSLTFKTKIMQAIPQIDEHCFYVDVEYVIYPITFLETAAIIDDAIYHYRLGTINQSVNQRNLETRISQHEHVLSVLCDYFEKHVLPEDVSNAKKDLVVRRVVQMANTNYMIYLRMESLEEASKIAQFDSLLQSYPDVYSGCTDARIVGQKHVINYLLPRLRKKHFRNLRTVCWLVQTWDKLRNN